MTKAEITQNETSVLHHLVEDLFVIKPAVYWADYIFCTILGWGFFIISLLPNMPLYILPLSLLIAIFALYRSAVFSHEIAHFEKNLPRSFCMTWHIFTGMPLCAPGFMYKQLHLSHHRKNNYATQNDPEYADFSHSPFEVFSFVGISFFLPILGMVRFLILAPLSLFNSKIRHLVRTKASSMGIQIIFTRELPNDPKEMKSWNIQETTTSIWGWLLVLGWANNVIPWQFFMHWYILLAGIMLINALRALSATHVYDIKSKGYVNLEEQLSDSFNLTGNAFVTALLCPVGVRYHALHHIFPNIPYHSLNKAHLRLIKALPKNSNYHQASSKNS